MTSFHASSQLADDALARSRKKDAGHTCESHMLTRPRPKSNRVRSGAAVRLAAYLVAHPFVPLFVCPSVSLSLCLSFPTSVSTDFLTLFFLLLTLCFLVCIFVCLSLCPPWPLVQTVMICQSPCGPPICNSCFSHVFIGFLMCAPSRSLSQATTAPLRQQKVRKILFFCGKLVEINFLF